MISIFDTIIKDLLCCGVNVTLSFDKDEEAVFYNLDTGCKSDMSILELPTGKIMVKRRYNRVDYISTPEELCNLFIDCLHGRQYYNSSWDTFLEKYGYLNAFKSVYSECQKCIDYKPYYTT